MNGSDQKPLYEWAIIGPFGNTLVDGFEKPFPPEWEIDLFKEYEGCHGSIRWYFLYSDSLQDGCIDLLGPSWPEVAQIPTPPLKEYEIGYLFTNIMCDECIETELSVCSPFKIKIWVNNIVVFRSMSVDKTEHTFPISLKSGKNQLLVKIEKLLWWEWKLSVKFINNKASKTSNIHLKAVI